MSSVRLELPRPAKSSRGILLLRLLFGWLYAGIPHYICLFAVSSAMGAISFVAFWAVLFSGRYPKGLFTIITGLLDWQARISVYLNFLRDEYPPLGFTSTYPARVVIDYPEKLSRGLLLLRAFFGFLYILIPHGICLFIRQIAHGVITFIAWWAVLFTGKIPERMFSFLSGTYRWSLRVSAYCFFLTDEYPPFSGKAEA